MRRIWYREVYQLPDMLKMGINSYGQSFQGSFFRYRVPFLFSLHHMEHPDFLFSQIICLLPLPCVLTLGLFCVWLHAWCWGWSEIILPVGPGFLPNGNNGWVDLISAMFSVSLNRQSLYNIIHNLSGGCVVGARLQTISTGHMLWAGLEGWLS